MSKPGDYQPQAAQSLDGLIHQAKKGCQNSLADVLEPCRGYLLLVANQALGKEMQAKLGASDLVQDTFVRARQHFDRFNGSSEADLLAWLRRILLNHLADVARSYTQTEKRRLDMERPWPQDRTPLAIAPFTPADAAIEAEELARMRHAMSMLTEEYRTAIELRSIERQSFAVLAKRLNRSEDAARKTWTRAVAKLAELLGALDESY